MPRPLVTRAVWGNGGDPVSALDGDAGNHHPALRHPVRWGALSEATAGTTTSPLGSAARDDSFRSPRMRRARRLLHLTPGQIVGSTRSRDGRARAAGLRADEGWGLGDGATALRRHARVTVGEGMSVEPADHHLVGRSGTMQSRASTTSRSSTGAQGLPFPCRPLQQRWPARGDVYGDDRAMRTCVRDELGSSMCRWSSHEDRRPCGRCRVLARDRSGRRRIHHVELQGKGPRQAAGSNPAGGA